MKHHPRKYELLGYAETLVDNRAAIPAHLAAHIAACPACQAEVAAIRASLELARKVPDLEPSNDLTVQILIAAQKARRSSGQRRSGRAAARTLVKGLAYAAGVILVGAVCFSAALNTTSPKAGIQGALPQQMADTALSPEAIRKATSDIQTLVSAVSLPSKTPPSPWEVKQRREVHALNTDIEAARAALERNPGCDRATHMVDTNLQRQVQTLRTLYVERNL